MKTINRATKQSPKVTDMVDLPELQPAGSVTQQPMAMDDAKAPAYSHKRLDLLIGAAALVVVIAAALLLVHHKNSSNPYAYSYTNLQSVKISGDADSTNMSFKLPTEFGLSTAASGPDHKTYTQNSLTAKPALIGDLSASSQSFVTGLDSATYDKATALIDALNQPGSQNYNAAAQPIILFAQAAFPKGYKTTVSSAVALRTDNLKTNAWKFDITSTNSTNPSLPQLKGEAVFVWSQKAAYSLVFAATDQNWKSNSQTWQAMINSIEVDQ